MDKTHPKGGAGSRTAASERLVRACVFVCCVLPLTACHVSTVGTEHHATEPGDADGSGLPPSSDGDEPVLNVLAAAPSVGDHAAAQTFVELCSACHGDWAEGSSAPSLWSLPRTRADLIAKIEQTMPPKDPALCSGACAETMADYLISQFGEGARKCEGIPPSPRQLRLLTRREYQNTVRTLLGAHVSGDGVPTQRCGSYTFSFDPGAAVASVHVAGTFNAWADAAWPMTYSESDRRWTLTRELAPGQHEFKYVVRSAGDAAPDWRADPTLPQTGAYGNSALTIASCESEPAPEGLDFSSLPSETRPVAFPFATTVRSVVGTQQFEAYFDTAKKVAFAIRDLRGLVGCDLALDRAGCGRTFLSVFGKRAFRRPLTSAELERYLALLTTGDDAEEAARTTVAALLASPGFLYRSELGSRQADGSYLLTPHELASALSYTFVADMPDDALLAAADQGELANEAQLRAQAERLLKKPESRSAVATFVLEWLGVAGVTALTRGESEHPEFTPSLRASMRAETERLVQHVLFESSGSVTELLSADYTFANAELATLYGMEGEFDGTLRKVPYGDGARAGVLGHASVLATYAHENQTSPVLRGLFVRRQLLCQRFGEPPPNAGTVPALDPGLSTRERFDMHSSESCASCHVHIDGVGFGFEHFDELGAYREREGSHELDAQGEITGLGSLRDGTHAAFGSPRELAPLLSESEATHRCVAKQSFRYIRGALDSGLQYCALKYVRQRYRESKGRILEALLASVESVDFRYRY